MTRRDWLDLAWCTCAAGALVFGLCIAYAVLLHLVALI